MQEQRWEGDWTCFSWMLRQSLFFKLVLKILGKIREATYDKFNFDGYYKLCFNKSEIRNVAWLEIFYFMKIGKEGQWAQWALYYDKQQRWKTLHSHHITFSGARENQEERN